MENDILNESVAENQSSDTIENNQEDSSVQEEQTMNNEIIEEEQPLDEPQPIQQVEGVYYYDKIYEDGHFGQYVASTASAYAYGWQDNVIAQSDTERGYEGRLYVKGKAPVKGLDLLKAEKLTEISAVADAFEQMKCDAMFVTSSLGFRVNADRRSLQNVENMVSLGESQQFKDCDNTFHYLSVEELKVIAHEIILNGLNLYSQKFAMQQQIASATDYDTVANFEVDFQMMDFSE